jgi:hypothetical protein
MGNITPWGDATTRSLAAVAIRLVAAMYCRVRCAGIYLTGYPLECEDAGGGH